MIRLIFIKAAVICFFLGALQVPSRIRWDSAGFCCLTIALFLA